MAEIARFTFTGDRFDRFLQAFAGKVDEAVIDALYEIRHSFALELQRQQKLYHRNGKWAAWKPGYAARREQEYAKGITQYKTKLKRTGAMLQGYIQGIDVFPKELTVIVNYPTGYDEAGRSLNVRAKAHQGIIRRPKGMPARPFDRDAFYTAAFKRIERAIRTKYV